jgi:hypothetical protein
MGIRHYEIYNKYICDKFWTLPIAKGYNINLQHFGGRTCLHLLMKQQTERTYTSKSARKSWSQSMAFDGPVRNS